MRLDPAHLARQTMHEPALAREVLGLFVEQAKIVRARIRLATFDERRLLAHGLRGSAAGVGAFAVAAEAARLESAPARASHTRGLESLIDETLAEIAAYLA